MTGKAGGGSKVNISLAEGDEEIADEEYKHHKLCRPLHAKFDIQTLPNLIYITGML